MRPPELRAVLNEINLCARQPGLRQHKGKIATRSNITTIDARARPYCLAKSLDSKVYGLASRLTASWMQASVMKAARVSARLS